MRSLLSFLFIAFLLWNFLGFFTYFQIEKYSAKKAFKQKLKKAVPENELHTFIFTSEQVGNLIWYEKHEFEYQNVMYDVVSSDTIENGAMKYSCVSDMQETILFAQLDQLVHKKVNEENELPFSNWKLVVSQPQFLASIPEIVWTKEIFNKNLNYFHSLFQIRSGAIQAATPPPKSSAFLS